MQTEQLYFKVSPRIWDKPWGDATKLLALYILSNRHRITEGLYRLPKSYICGDMSWTPEQLQEPFNELLAAGFIEYDDAAAVVFIPNALKYQRPANPNVEKNAAKRLRELPDTRLFEKLLTAAKAYAPTFAERLPELLPERFR